eukprot:CAMPEP_0174752724 /NCGR_PEP_ID=MMETSP1094-20130205/102631_1 /TAXON_ID=156173 /ORGANISM="Chrysochromulina brevifilum, Strain UTEX LB 985" /LENGTH=47 /DNA_ID= /DNA_START= /DNA_END= /DNA_ORIENTATION=
MTVTALSYISFMGVSMYQDLQWAELPSTPHGRLYTYLPRFQWAAVFM